MIQRRRHNLWNLLWGINDVNGEPIDPSLIVKARQEEMHGFKDAESVIMLHEELLTSVQKESLPACAG